VTDKKSGDDSIVAVYTPEDRPTINVFSDQYGLIYSVAVGK
jgi:hypothetical protein